MIHVDLLIGGLAENHAPNARLGTTFQRIIGDQFLDLRVGDRFYWQNQKFDAQTASTISKTTLATLLGRDTDSTTIQDNVFAPTKTTASVKPAAALAPSATTPIITNSRPFIFEK
jgi:hypothetical protein